MAKTTSDRFAGKVVLITGSTRGIGRAAARVCGTLRAGHAARARQGAGRSRAAYLAAEARAWDCFYEAARTDLGYRDGEITLLLAIATASARSGPRRGPCI